MMGQAVEGHGVLSMQEPGWPDSESLRTHTATPISRGANNKCLLYGPHLRALLAQPKKPMQPRMC